VKVFFVIFLFFSALDAAPYVGLQGSYFGHQSNIKLKGKDFVPVNNYVRFLNVQKMRQNALGLGMLIGYNYRINFVFSGFVEAGYTYLNSHKLKRNIDVLEEEGLPIRNQLDDEKVSIRIRHQISMVPGFYISILDNLSGIMACGLTVTQYCVTAAHAAPGGNIRCDNIKTKRSFVFGIEPTLGVQYKTSDKVSTRLTVGYNIGQNKRVIDNYIGSPGLSEKGVRSGVWIKPCSLNIRAAMIFEF